MFINKNAILKIRTKADLANDNSILTTSIGFKKNNIYLTNEMLEKKQVLLPHSCELKNGFVFAGWYWYDWMFDLNNYKNLIFLKTE